MSTYTGNRSVKKWTHLHPRTSTKPILLRDYLIGERRTLVMNGECLSEEWKRWYWKQIAKGNDVKKEGDA